MTNGEGTCETYSFLLLGIFELSMDSSDGIPVILVNEAALRACNDTIRIEAPTAGDETKQQPVKQQPTTNANPDARGGVVARGNTIAGLNKFDIVELGINDAVNKAKASGAMLTDSVARMARLKMAESILRGGN